MIHYFEKQLAFVHRNPMDRMRFIAERFEIEYSEIHHESFDVERKINYGKVTPIVKTFRQESTQKLKAMIGEI